MSSVFEDIIDRKPINQFENHHSCSISINVMTRGMTPFRIVLTTLTNEVKMQQTQVQIPLNLKRYSTICLDLPQIVQKCCPSTIYLGCNQIEGVSNISLKGIYFSDQKFDASNVPDIMQIPAPINKQEDQNIQLPLIQCYDWYENDNNLNLVQIPEDLFKDKIKQLIKQKQEQQEKIKQQQLEQQKKLEEFQQKYKSQKQIQQQKEEQRKLRNEQLIKQQKEDQQLHEQDQIQKLEQQPEQIQEEDIQDEKYKQIIKKVKKQIRYQEIFKNIDQTFELEQSMNQSQILKLQSTLGCNQQSNYKDNQGFESYKQQLHDYEVEDLEKAKQQVCNHINNYMQSNILSYINGEYKINKLEKHSLNIINLYGDVYALLLNNKYFVTIYTESKQFNITINTIKMQIEQQLQKEYDKSLYELSSYIQSPNVQHINATDTQILIVFDDVIALFRYKILQGKIQVRLQHIMYTSTIKINQIDSSIICNDNKIILAGKSRKQKQTFWCINMKVENLQQMIKDKLQDIQLFQEAIILETSYTYKNSFWKIQSIRNNQFIALSETQLILLQYQPHKLDYKLLDIYSEQQAQQVSNELITCLLNKCPQAISQIIKDEIAVAANLIVKENKFIDISVVDDKRSKNKLDQLICIVTNNSAFTLISVQKLLQNQPIQSYVLLNECKTIISSKVLNNGKLILTDIGGRIMQFDMYNDYNQIAEAINFQIKMIGIQLIQANMNEKIQSSFIFSQSNSYSRSQIENEDFIQIQSISCTGDIGITTIQDANCKYQTMFQFVCEPILDFSIDPSDPSQVSIVCYTTLNIFKNQNRSVILKLQQSRRLISYSSTKFLISIYNIDLNQLEVIDLDNEDNEFIVHNVFQHYQKQGNDINCSLQFTQDGKYILLLNQEYGLNIYEILYDRVILIKNLQNIKQICETQIKCGLIYSIMYCVDNQNRVKYALTNTLFESGEWRPINIKNQDKQTKIIPNQAIPNYLFIIKLFKEELKTQFSYKLKIEVFDVFLNKFIENEEIFIGFSEFDENPEILTASSKIYGTLLIGLNLQGKCHLINYNGPESVNHLRKQVIPFQIDKLLLDSNEDIQVAPQQCQTLMKFIWNHTDKVENLQQEKDQLLKLQQRIISKKIDLLTSSSSLTQWSLQFSSKN